MELLRELNTFMLSGWGVLTSIGIVAWLIVGITLFRKIFVMGLIGCTRKEDNVFAVMYTAACILLWPIYLVWLFSGVIDIKKITKRPQVRTRYKHKVMGGVYEKLAIARHTCDVSPSYPNNMLFAVGRGKSNEPVHFYKRNDNTDYRYRGAVNYGDIIVYKDLKTNKCHLSTPEEFEQNFIKQ